MKESIRTFKVSSALFTHLDVETGGQPVLLLKKNSIFPTINLSTIFRDLETCSFLLSQLTTQKKKCDYANNRVKFNKKLLEDLVLPSIWYLNRQWKTISIASFACHLFVNRKSANRVRNSSAAVASTSGNNPNRQPGINVPTVKALMKSNVQTEF